VRDERRRMALVVLDSVRIPGPAEWCCWHHVVTTLDSGGVQDQAHFARRACLAREPGACNRCIPLSHTQRPIIEQSFQAAHTTRLFTAPYPRPIS
jgi:hypothetical protein